MKGADLARRVGSATGDGGPATGPAADRPAVFLSVGFFRDPPRIPRGRGFAARRAVLKGRPKQPADGARGVRADVARVSRPGAARFARPRPSGSSSTSSTRGNLADDHAGHLHDRPRDGAVPGARKANRLYDRGASAVMLMILRGPEPFGGGGGVARRPSSFAPSICIPRCVEYLEIEAPRPFLAGRFR